MIGLLGRLDDEQTLRLDAGSHRGGWVELVPRIQHHHHPPLPAGLSRGSDGQGFRPGPIRGREPFHERAAVKATAGQKPIEVCTTAGNPFWVDRPMHALQPRDLPAEGLDKLRGVLSWIGLGF